MSRRKNNIQSDYTMDDLADSLLSRILACVDQKAQSNDITKGAIVTRVNEDGTVNVKLPADEEGHEFTKISNQSVYELSVGDSVELYLKGGRYSNCWVIAKHGMGRKRVALETQKGNTVVVGGGSSTGGGSGTIPESILKHLVDYNNPHRVTKEQLGLSKVVTSINGESGDVTIPTVINDAKLTIQQNGTEVGNFTANSAVDKTVNITVPTKLSELEDDSSFAKTSELPTKTSELENDSGYITSSDIPSIPVTTVNGKTGAVVLNATDVRALPNTTVIPTTTSQLTNNSGYITSAGAPVQSVNGKIGTVSLTANDVGALPDTTTIPVVNNAKLTIQKNGVAVDSFTANASVDKIINIEVPTKASDIKAISTDDISQILGNSETKVPSEKAVAQAMSAAGYGDMLKANYATKSDSIVDKSYADENGDNIASTYLPKFKLLNNTDANSLITSQICVIGAGNTNLPDEATGSVLFVAGDGTNAFQIIVVYATNTLNHRAYKDGAWTIWRNTEAKTSTDSATNFDAYGLGFITEE